MSPQVSMNSPEEQPEENQQQQPPSEVERRLDELSSAVEDLRRQLLEVRNEMRQQTKEMKEQKLREANLLGQNQSCDQGRLVDYRDNVTGLTESIGRMGSGERIKAETLKSNWLAENAAPTSNKSEALGELLIRQSTSSDFSLKNVVEHQPREQRNNDQVPDKLNPNIEQGRALYQQWNLNASDLAQDHITLGACQVSSEGNALKGAQFTSDESRSDILSRIGQELLTLNKQSMKCSPLGEAISFGANNSENFGNMKESNRAHNPMGILKVQITHQAASPSANVEPTNQALNSHQTEQNIEAAAMKYELWETCLKQFDNFTNGEAVRQMLEIENAKKAEYFASKE